MQNPNKNTALKSLFNKVTGLLKKDSKKGFFVWNPNFLRTFLTEHLRMTVSRFFNSFYCFLPPSQLTETMFSPFLNMFYHDSPFEYDEYHEFCIWKTSLCEANDLVIAVWEHTFLWDITWNLAVFLDWLILYIYTLIKSRYQPMFNCY